MKTIFLIANSMFFLALAGLVFATVCNISQIPCSDNTCNETDCDKHGGKRLGSCNDNGVCELGEECGCRDCILEYVNTSCSSNLLCSSSGFCMENCTALVSEEVSLIDIFAFTKTAPKTANVFVANFDYWILDEYGNQQSVEVGLKTW